MRRHDIDWLRILLFALLVPHHAAVGFVAWGEPIYGFVNADLGPPLLELFIYWSHGWRLPSLFVIAGIGTWFAASGGAGAGFMARRIARLMVPALFGTFFLNVFHGYVIAQETGAPPGFPAFWWRWITAPEPRQVGHLWFLYNLTLYTLLCWPLIALRPALGRRRARPLPLLGGLVIVSAAIIVATMPYRAALAGEGYQFPWYLWFFAAGFAIGAWHRDVLDWAARRVGWLLLAAVMLFVAKIALLEAEAARGPAAVAALAGGGWATSGTAPAFGPTQVAFATVKALNAWAWILAAAGLCARYLNRPGRWLPPLSDSVFAIYVLHFPITLIGLSWVKGLALPWWQGFWLLTGLVYAGTAVAYLLATRAGRLVYLVGGRPVPRVPAT